MLEKWYPTKEEGSKKGVLLVMTAGKEGAVTGGEEFMKAVGEELIDSIVGDQIPIYTEQEKYNLTVESSVERLAAALTGKEVPGALAAPGRHAPAAGLSCILSYGCPPQEHTAYV